jgi:hypothetical protein
MPKEATASACYDPFAEQEIVPVRNKQMTDAEANSSRT